MKELPPGRSQRKHQPEGAPALPAGLRVWAVVVAGFAAAILIALGARYAGDASPGPLDAWLQSAVRGWWPHPRPGALVIDFVGEPWGVASAVAVLLAACLALGRRRLSVVAIVSTGVTGIVTTTLQSVFGRTIHEGFLSYPSGHTAIATVLGLVVMLLIVDLTAAGRVLGALLILSGAAVCGVGMALSQIALGAHYPTDTVGGFCAAMAVVPVTAYLTDLLVARGR